MPAVTAAAAVALWFVFCASDDAWCEYGEYGVENLFRNIAIVDRGSAQRSVTVGMAPVLAIWRPRWTIPYERLVTRTRAGVLLQSQELTFGNWRARQDSNLRPPA